MKFLFDFFPVVLFFVVYKFYVEIPAQAISTINDITQLSLTPGHQGDAIYLATAVAIAASFVQVSAFWLKHRHFEKTHIISLVIITLFGGATLALQDPVFIKWKPTILNWVFALVVIGSQFIGKKTIIERMMGHAINVPADIWRRVNLAWAAFFIFSGLANIYVAYTFSEAFWVDFKLFGLLGLTLVFAFGQAFYLARFIESNDEQQTS
jgi:intracellular septation protein